MCPVSTPPRRTDPRHGQRGQQTAEQHTRSPRPVKAEFVQRRNRRRILELAGKITFRPGWDYKQMRGAR